MSTRPIVVVVVALLVIALCGLLWLRRKRNSMDDNGLTATARAAADAVGGGDQLVYEHRRQGRDLLAEYSVQIFLSGQIVYEGRANVAVKGKRVAQIEPAQAQALFDEARRLDLLALKLSAVPWLPGSVPRSITLIQGGKKGTIHLGSYAPADGADKPGWPIQSLLAFEMKIGDAIQVIRPWLERKVIAYEVYGAGNDTIPEYVVRLFSDGEVVFNGNHEATRTSTARHQIKAEQARALMALVEQLRFQDYLDDVVPLAGKPQRKIVNFGEEENVVVVGQVKGRDAIIPATASLEKFLRFERELRAATDYENKWVGNTAKRAK